MCAMNRKKLVIAGAAAFTLMYNELNKKKCRKRRHWVTALMRSRDVYDGNCLLNDLSVSNSGQFQNFLYDMHFLWDSTALDFPYIN